MYVIYIYNICVSLCKRKSVSFEFQVLPYTYVQLLISHLASARI